MLWVSKKKKISNLFLLFGRTHFFVSTDWLTGAEAVVRRKSTTNSWCQRWSKQPKTIGKTAFLFVSVYAPQANLSEVEKDRFYQMLQCTVATIPISEQLIVCGDWNGHIGSQSTGLEEVHGGQAIGKRNTEGERILEFAFANKLVVGNIWFNKKPKHLVTYQSGVAATQIDFILYQRSFRKQVSNVKVILGEECASQHRLLFGDFKVSIPPQPKFKFAPHIKV